MKTKTLLACALLAAASGCRNTPMQGQTAPTLTSRTWVLPEGMTEPPARKSGAWTLLAFFRPH